MFSCGNTQESSSEPSESVSEVTTEEPTTELETEAPTEKEIVLDTTWECDYLTIAKSSEWDEQIKEDNDEISVFWYDYKISLFLGESTSSGKMSEEDLVKCYSDLQYDDYKILDTFEKNGQAYLIMGTESTGSRDLMFQTNKVNGTIYYSVEDEELIMQMIDSIEFKEDIATKKTNENTKTVGCVSFELPEDCIEKEVTVSKGECFEYTFSDNSMLTVKKSPDYAGLSTDYNKETIEQILETLLSSTFDDMKAVFDDDSDFEIQDLPEPTLVNGNFTLKQKAVAYDLFRYAMYDFVCGDNVYLFCFSDLRGIAAYEEQEEILKSISFNY